jgi:hypothetical protein
MKAFLSTNWQLISVVIVAILVLGSVSLYRLGEHNGYKKGYASGHGVGFKDGVAYDLAHPATDIFSTHSEEDYTKLQTQYNDLAAQYNNLRTEAIKYVNANSYKAVAPLHCTSNTFSGTTTTNCY